MKNTIFLYKYIHIYSILLLHNLYICVWTKLFLFRFTRYILFPVYLRYHTQYLFIMPKKVFLPLGLLSFSTTKINVYAKIRNTLIDEAFYSTKTKAVWG